MSIETVEIIFAKPKQTKRPFEAKTCSQIYSKKVQNHTNKLQLERETENKIKTSNVI